jgi:hypothetical protein
MKDFNENQPLLDSIEANDLKEIKRILIDNIFFLKGDSVEIYKAVEYAMEKSDFKFEAHEEIDVINPNNKEDCFSDEQWNMRKNYSRERYDLLVELFNETFAKQNYTNDNTKGRSNDKLIKKAIIGGVIMVAGYLIYKAIVNE